MIYPVVAYGHPVLKKVAREIDKDYPELKQIIENMFETMYEAVGVGLAAPQVNLSIRLIVIDADPYKTNYPEAEGFKKVFINPQIISEEGEAWEFEEACLSLPGIAEFVMRKPKLTIKYLDEDFKEHEEVFDGMLARIIQHEYDHLEGVLFVERVSNLKKMLLKNKLSDITKGKVDASYKMIFAPQKRKAKK